MITKEEIIDLASRYVEQNEIKDFPFNGDFFAFFTRESTVQEGKWNFGGYALCQFYDIDYEAKPEGSRLKFVYLSLSSFPPKKVVFNLQPPHVVKCQCQNADRLLDIRFEKLVLNQPVEPVKQVKEVKEEQQDSKILKFRLKTPDSKNIA